MTEIIGAWERKAKVCLVDTATDKEIFTQLLTKLEQENSSNDAVYKDCIAQIERAKDNLSNADKYFFICMFVWNYETQHYFPFTSTLFDDDDVDALQKYVKKFIDVSIQFCSDGFEVTTFNDNNKLLAYALQLNCENEMMQFNLHQYQSKQ